MKPKGWKIRELKESDLNKIACAGHDCEEKATHCEHSPFDVSGRSGISFFYLCPDHAGRILMEEAKRKARYGHNDWLFWRNKEGIPRAEKCTRESMKRCLLDIGTQGKFSLLAASSSISFRDNWKIGVNILNHFKYA
jgi:hypothetical protein